MKQILLEIYSYNKLKRAAMNSEEWRNTYLIVESLNQAENVTKRIIK